jgi:hypothetical protein
MTATACWMFDMCIGIEVRDRHGRLHRATPNHAAQIIVSRIDGFESQCMLRVMLRRADIRFARMSSGHRCLIRDLGLVKGGKGLRHHEVVLELSLRGLLRFVVARIKRSKRQQQTARQDASSSLKYGDSAFEI